MHRDGEKIKIQLKMVKIIFVSCIACGIRESPTKLQGSMEHS
jgi:hypothetical protein